ncbi:YqaJ viral recombinase family protein [Pseudomonas laurylsulfatiphila]|uniref:YqaJ viral recombinase family protein n=1 Tax=Pseudomonas laurylsulfatiphila TaxID=2011015 RepID=UPI003D1A6DE2
MTKTPEYNSFRLPDVAKGITSGTQQYSPPGASKDVISREATDTSTAAQRKQEKATRRKQLAYFMARASGGTQAQFEKVIASEDWDDLDVQEMLLEDRFARYREVPVVSTSDAVKATVAQTNKNATTRKLETIQRQRDFVGKETGAISSKFEENSTLLTPETVVAGKIKAAGLENELAAVLNKYEEYNSMSSSERQQSFSKEEVSIFNSIAITGLTPSKLTSKKSILDFGDVGGTFDDDKEDLGSLSVVDFDYAQDNKTPHSSLAAIFGAYRESLSGATYDILPINKNEVSSDLLHNEFSLKAPAKYPAYMQPARAMKGSTIQEQHNEALGLPDNANVQEYFDKLAEQYIDPEKLEYMSTSERNKAVKLISMQISKLLPKRLKEISVQNATSIQSNDDNFNALVEEHGVDEAVRMVGRGGGNIIPPTAAYNAYPSPHELVMSLNSSKLREYAADVVKRGMTKKGIWTDDPEQMDTMSTLLTYGTHNLSYSKFEHQDDEYQQATVKRAALTELPKQLGRIYGISDSEMSRRSWEGGLQLNYEVLEQSLDDQLNESDVSPEKPQLDRELEHKPAQLDRYARDELARTVDVYFQPAGDLAADYKDNNLTQVDEYLELVAADVDLQDDDGSPVPPPDDDRGEGEGHAYVDPTALEAYSREGPPPVDDSFATAAPSVDMQAVEGVREGASTNKRASYGTNLGESQATTSATSGSRLGQSAATRGTTLSELPTEFKVKEKPKADNSKTEGAVKVTQPESKPIVAAATVAATPVLPTEFKVKKKPVPTNSKPQTVAKPAQTEAKPIEPVVKVEATVAPVIEVKAPVLGTKDERLALAREDYQSKNPDITISTAPQGSQEWLDDRKKLVTASDVNRVVGTDRTRNNFVGEKAAENWGMTTTKPYSSEDIERGHRLEGKIRQQYEKQTDTEILEMGLLQSKSFPGGASLDGLVTKDGEATKKGVEFKAPREFREFSKYHDQVQMQMAVAKLDSVDIVQGVEVDGKLRTQTQTVNKDLEWQKRNKHKIEQAQASIARNAAMTQEEFLAAQATMASDKSGKYGFLVSASKNDVEDALGKKKGSGGSGGKGGGGKGKGIFADPSDRNPNHRKREEATDPEPRGKQRGWLSTAYNTVKDVTQMVDRNAQELAAGFREDIGKPLDYGVNPGQYLANNIALRGAGVADRDARSATLSGASMSGAMELGDYSGAVSQVVGTLGLEDLGTKKQLADNPTERALRIIKNAKDRNMSPMATAEALRRSGLEGFGTLANLSQEEQASVTEKTKEQPQAAPQSYANANRTINQGAEVVHRRSLGAAAVNAGITKDPGYAQKEVAKLKNIPASIGSAIDEAGNSLTGITGKGEGSESGFNESGGTVYSGKVQREPVDVNVTVKLEGNVATVEASAGGKTATTTQSYHQSTVQ